MEEFDFGCTTDGESICFHLKREEKQKGMLYFCKSITNSHFSPQNYTAVIENMVPPMHRELNITYKKDEKANVSTWTHGLVPLDRAQPIKVPNRRIIGVDPGKYVNSSCMILDLY